MVQRIAISGSAGVGKSTLAKALAAECGVPYIPEGMREYLESTKVDLHDLGVAGLRALVLRLWEERQEAEARYSSFVADRASYDFVAFWMFYGFAREDADTERLISGALRRDRYDEVFVLPWGSIPLVADGIRSTNRFAQLQVQAMIAGLCSEFGPTVTWVSEVSLAERVAFVRRKFSR